MTDCCICLEKPDNPINLSCCVQEYCAECIITYLQTNKQCCMCRSNKTIFDINFINPIGNSGETVKFNKRLIGCKVKRGPDWNYNNQDGGDGNIGIIFKYFSKYNDVYVRWKDYDYNTYSIGNNNKYDIVFA
jgi:E3 ubiquitin-protein ligase mind-bomb